MARKLRDSDINFDSFDDDNVEYVFWTGSMFVNVMIHMGYFVRVTSANRTPFYSKIELTVEKRRYSSNLFLYALTSGSYLTQVALTMYEKIMICKLEPINLPC